MTGLREAIALAFYEAEKHVPAKDGHCEKCGFVHCEVGHVLAMAQEGVEAALETSSAGGALSYKELDRRYDLMRDEIIKLRHELEAAQRAALAQGSAGARDEQLAGIARKFAASTVEGLVRRNIIGRYMADEADARDAIADSIKGAIHESLAAARGDGSGVTLTLEDITTALDYASEGRANWQGIKPDMLGNQLNRVLRRAVAAAHPSQEGGGK